jgi:ERF superfamily
MRTSEHTDIIDDATSKAQAELENPTKDASNPHYRSRYATLDGGLNIVRPCLSKHGISVYQSTRVEDGVLMLDTRLACKGQWVEAEYPVCTFPAKPQELGSALTYARRYSLFSLVGIAGEEDDDGNAANATATQAPKRAAKPDNKVSPELSAEAKGVAIKAIEMAQTLEILQSWGVDNKAEMERMTASDLAEVRAAFKAKHDELKNAQKEAA